MCQVAAWLFADLRMTRAGMPALQRKSLSLAREVLSQQSKLLLRKLRWLLLLELCRRRLGGCRRALRSRGARRSEAGRSRARAGVRRQLLQIILQQADFDPAAGDALRLRALFGRRDGSIAHADDVDAVDRNLMVKHQVADHRVRHLLRILDGGLAATCREALHFDNVPALSLQRGSHVIQSLLRVLAQHRLSGAE